MNHMSEPLYRIWDIRNKYYISNKDFFVNLNGNVGHLRSYQKDEYYIIQRCTGEQDVNGKYIYEGDIVAFGLLDACIAGCTETSVMFEVYYLYASFLTNIFVTDLCAAIS